MLWAISLHVKPSIQPRYASQTREGAGRGWCHSAAPHEMAPSRACADAAGATDAAMVVLEDEAAAVPC